ncbi:GIY-YIG nuclease family protein [Streptomyces sp. NPDC005892]|uniref:GIY-YIG nuclease family protein n=1 Tax=Streptomyces sp. NPDC005892 TaxID=3155593 RepID=UPI0034053C68
MEILRPPQFVTARAIEESLFSAAFIRNALLDPGLSAEAKGVLCGITEASGVRGLGIAEICALSNDNAEMVKRTVEKLVHDGYLVRRPLRKPDGTSDGSIYQPAGGHPLGRSVNGFAYAISAPDRKLVKIGCTKDPRKRLAALQSASPLPLAFIWLQVGGYELERHLHKTLVRRRVRGEWFDFSNTDAAWMIGRAAELFESS